MCTRTSYTYTYALCRYTRHLRTCRYAVIHVNRPSGISQAVDIAVNHTQGVKMNTVTENYWLIYVAATVIMWGIVSH